MFYRLQCGSLLLYKAVRQNEMYHMEIVLDEEAYDHACLDFYSAMATKLRDKLSKETTSQPKPCLLIPVREMPPMQYNMESFYLSLLYYLARTVTSVEELNSLIRQLNDLGSSQFILEQLKIWESLASAFIHIDCFHRLTNDF